jgi:Flp pilus assembly protein TadB
MLLIGGGVALVGALALLTLALVTGGSRAAVSKTVRTADEGYRIATGGAPAATGPVRRLPRPAFALGRVLTPPGMTSSIVRRLDQAGNPAWLSAESLPAYKGLLAMGGAVLALGVAVVFAGPLTWLLWAALGGVAGFFVPDLIVLHLAQERQELIRRTLPDVMDTLVVTVEAGMGFEAALAQVVRNGRGPMVGEFARVLHEMQIGRPRVDALRQMAARTNVTELRAFASAVVQATTLGIPMAKVLRQQSAEMRVRRRQRAEEIAQKVPVKILIPMILCIFPVLFIVVVGPGVIRILDVFGR